MELGGTIQHGRIATSSASGAANLPKRCLATGFAGRRADTGREQKRERHHPRPDGHVLRAADNGQAMDRVSRAGGQLVSLRTACRHLSLSRGSYLTQFLAVSDAGLER